MSSRDFFRLPSAEERQPVAGLEPQPYKNVSFLLWVVVAFSALTGLLMGFDLSVVAVILNRVDAEFELCPGGAVECWKRRVFVSMIAPGALIGSLGGGWLADAWGRRYALLASDISFILGSGLFLVRNSVVTIFMARTIVGLGIGIGFVVFATYIAEIAPPSLRGRLILCQEIAQCVGVLATYTMAYVLKTDNWRLFAVSGGFIAIVQLIGLALLPESPRWLMMQDRVADAYQVMRRLGIDKTDLDSGESELRRSGTGVARHHVTSLLWTYRSELLTACFVGFAQNLLCLNAILYFSTDLFYLAQVCAPYEWGMGVGIVKLCGTLLIFPLVDTFGRRKLLLIGTGALFGANLLMAYAYGLSPMKNVASAEAFCESVQGADLGPTGLAGIHSVLMLVSLYLVVLCWEISWAGLMYVVASEIIPSTIRGIGMGIVIFFFWVSSFFSQLLFETLFDLITVIGTFVGLSIMALLVLVITYISVPDMTGKSLESIRRLMSGCNDNAILEPYFTDAENGSFQQRDISPFARSTPSTTMSHIKRRQGPTENGVLSSKQDLSSDVSTLLSSS